MNTCVNNTERYMTEADDSSCDDSLHFWNHCHQSYPLLSPLAEDPVSAPASQAYVERVFSVCGDLSVCRTGFF